MLKLLQSPAPLNTRRCWNILLFLPLVLDLPSTVYPRVVSRETNHSSRRSSKRQRPLVQTGQPSFSSIQPAEHTRHRTRFDRVACITKSSSIGYLFRLEARNSMAPEYLRYCGDWFEWAVQVKCLYVFVEAARSGLFLFRWENRRNIAWKGQLIRETER